MERCEKNERNLLTDLYLSNIIYLALCEAKGKTSGVWLSLARAPGLGPGGRRFESCHPDFYRKKDKKIVDR